MIFDVAVGERTLRVEVKGRGDRYTVLLDGKPFGVDVQETARGFLSLLVDGKSYDLGLEKRGNGYTVSFADDALHVELTEAARGAAAPHARAAGPVRVKAPMPGKIVRVLVEPGQAVQAFQGLVVMEAMKMENEIRAPRAGTVREVAVREGQAVETAALLALLE